MVDQQAHPQARLEKWVNRLVVGGLAFLSLLLLANSMAKPVGHDEQMYCTAGVLTADGQTVYRDFSYIAQPPYHAVLLAAAYKVCHTPYYLLVGRMVSVACDILTLVFIVLIYRSVFGRSGVAGSLFGLAAAALCVFNPLLGYAAGYAWNHDAVMVCVIASLWVFLRMTESESPNRYLHIGVIVALLTLATCMRITTALIEGVFLIAVLTGLAGSVLRRAQTTAVFAGIAIVVAAWPIWVAMRAPQAVWLNLVRIPELCARWLQQRGTTYDKAALAFNCLTTPAYLILLALIVVTVLLFLRRWSRLDGRAKGHFILMAAVPAVFILIAFVPLTMWLQYWGVPVPFLATLLALPLAESVKTPRRVGTTVVSCGVIAAVVITMACNLGMIYQSAILLVPERWTPVELHALAAKIAAHTAGSQPVLTLGPLYALEAGDRIYPELSCGDFTYRVADLMTAEERQITHTVGPADVAALIAERPPAAVLVGVELPTFAGLEEPLRRAAQPGWLRVDVGDDLQLYVRPQ
jgi:hypothetical protein